MYHLNEIIEGTGYSYLCKETSDGSWLIMRISDTSVFSYASVLNNPTVTTYQDARNNYDTLTYGNWDDAQ